MVLRKLFDSRVSTLRNNSDLSLDVRGVAGELVGTALYVHLGSSISAWAHIGVFGTGPAAVMFVALGHLLALSVCIYAFTPISGGVFNPAVMLAMVATRNTPLLQGAATIAAEFVGGAAGAALTLAITYGRPAHGAGLGALVGTPLVPDIDSTVRSAFLSEALQTAILTFVAFAAAVKPRFVRKGSVLEPVQSMAYALPIGATLGLLIMAGGAGTGALTNPSRAFGTALISGGWHRSQWIYYTASPLGALVGGFLYEALKQQETPARRQDLIGIRKHTAALS